MKKIIISAILIGSTCLYGQVKVGSNVTTLATNANLQVEGTTTANQFVVLKNGNVGIGTTAPTHGLHLSGSSWFNSSMRISNSTASEGQTVQFIGDSCTYSVATYNSTSSFIPNSFGIIDNTVGPTTARLVINQSGNVGIGTIDPTEKLDVAGNVKFSGALMPNNAAGTAGQVLTSAGVGLVPTWTTPSSGANIYTNDGTLTSSRTLTQGNFDLTFKHSTASGITFNRGGASNNRIFMPSDGLEIQSNDVDLTKSVFDVKSSGVYKFSIKGNGNVGINVTAPSEKLDVAGNVKFSGALMPNNTAGTTGQVLTSAGVGVAPTWTTPSSGANIYTNDGTLTSSRILTQGNFDLTFKHSTASGITFNKGNAANNNRMFMPTDGLEIQSNDADMTKSILDVKSSGTFRFSVKGSGNVGIGTSAPTAQLHTTGSVQFAGAGTPGVGKVLTSDASGLATWQVTNDPSLDVDTASAAVAAPVQQAITAGSLQFTTTNTGVIMKSADGTNWMLSIENNWFCFD